MQKGKLTAKNLASAAHGLAVELRETIFEGKLHRRGERMAGEKELERLLEGNGRFVGGRGGKSDIGAKRRKDLVKGQKPFAIVVYCADSRSPVEHIFDVGLGEIFGVRVAGNILDDTTMGSIEYAAEHLGTPLVMIMGHEKCGAVSATCKGGHAPGHIASIVKRIAPALESVRKGGKLEGDALVEAVATRNVENMVALLKKESEIVRKLVEANKLKVVGAKYSLDSGKVTII